MSQYFIAVHAGAGFHAGSKEVAYAAAMHQALQAAAKCLQDGCSSVDAVMRAICVLEVCSELHHIAAVCSV
jgi:taspase (threonine aspartase 1)